MKLGIIAIALLSLALSGCEALLGGSTLTGCTVRATPEILPLTLPAGRIGQPYTARLDVINADTPVGKLLVSPRKPLPAGFELTHTEREKHGLIEGTPTHAATYQVLIYATTYGTQCAGQYVERLYLLDVTR